MSAILSDAIIVGAGPAGAAAAFDLARAGLNTVVLDRRAFPRTKPCAGALTIKSLKRLRFSIAPVIRYVARDLRVSLDQNQERVFSSRHPIAVMTVRRELDEFCLQQAIDQGAAFNVIDDIASISEVPAGVRLETGDGRVFEAGFLIGADGANSRVRRLMGRESAPRALALEGHVPIDRARPAPLMHFDFAAIQGGYGWVFPKGDHLNVGLYTQDPKVTFSKADLQKYARKIAGAEQIDEIVGYPLGIGGENFTQNWQRVFLVGDAAGGAERLLGEGIHNAIKSGQAAALAIISFVRQNRSSQFVFSKDMNEVKRDLEACSSAAKWFYQAAGLGYGALRLHPAKTALMRGFAAGKTFKEILQTALLSPLYHIRPVPAIVEFERAASAARSKLASTRVG